METASPRILAAVKRRVRPGEVGKAFRSAQDEVWAFLRGNPGLLSDGHNIFYYNHDGANAAGLDVHFGVEVTRRFAGHGPVSCVETPSGRAATTVHRGAYDGLGAAHEAIRRWFRDNGERIGPWSLEIYGDWCEDASKLNTTIMYGLA
jgi:effector-binding domain-containing protein